jgi:hypothetical protein
MEEKLIIGMREWGGEWGNGTYTDLYYEYSTNILGFAAMVPLEKYLECADMEDKYWCASDYGRKLSESEMEKLRSQYPIIRGHKI